MNQTISARPILGRRYKFTRRPIRVLNSIQFSAKAKIESKIEGQQYKLESVECAICDSNDFDLLSERDRYGLFVPIVICKICGLVQTNPRLDAPSYKLFYQNEYPHLYRGSSTPNEKKFTQRYHHGLNIIAYLKKNAPLKQNPKDMLVLDIGCSLGGILKAFVDQGFATVGIDLNESYLQYGRKHFGLDLRNCELSGLEIIRNPDIVIYNQVFEHILNPIGEVDILRNVLAPGGIVYIELPGVKNLLKSYGMDFLQYSQNAHVYHYSLRTLRNLFESRGYSLVAGDEVIRSVFQKSEKRSDVVLPDEYMNVKQSLLEAEYRRKKNNPFLNYKYIRAAYVYYLHKFNLYRVKADVRRAVGYFLRRVRLLFRRDF